MLINKNKQTMANQGKLDIIMGCMASGKSSELIRLYRRFKQTYTEEQIGLISHATDTRYGNQVISTHDKTQIKCLCISNFGDLESDDFKEKYIKWKVIFIEEAQFFSGLVKFVKHAVDIDQKHLIVIGLDGDFERKKFGEIISLIPQADNYTKLKAICYYCKDGTEAIFTKRIIGNNSQTLVGTLDMYKPVCRYHYLHKID